MLRFAALLQNAHKNTSSMRMVTFICINVHEFTYDPFDLYLIMSLDVL